MSSETKAADKPENTSSNPGPNLGRQLLLARLSLMWERAWPALWPATGLGGVFLTLAFFDILPELPIWLHGFVLAAIVIGILYALYLGIKSLALPGVTAARRRIESKSGLIHRPLSMLRDQLATGKNDPQSRALWQLHRLRTIEKIRGLRVGLPSPKLAHHDPLALRGALLVLLIIGITIAWGDGFNRIARALMPGVGSALNGPAVVDIWITPPAHTRLAPIFLNAGKQKPDVRKKSKPAPLLISGGSQKDAFSTKGGPQRVSIPEGSTILAQLAGGWGTPRIVLGTIDALFKPVADGTYKVTRKIAPGNRADKTRLTIRQGGSEIASWPVRIIPDQSPIIRFADDPGQSGRGALSIKIEGSDDYGIAKAKLYIRRLRIGLEKDEDTNKDTNKDGKDQKPEPETIDPETEAALKKLNAPHELALTLASNARAISETSFHDLTAHPWAGLEVSLQIIARDGANQPGATDSLTTVLPERYFRHPVARALVLLRKRLIFDPRSREDVVDEFIKLATIPGSFGDDTVTFLAIQSMARTLVYDPGLAVLSEIQKLMWDTALHLEDGKLSMAERRLREIQKKLMEALKKKAGNAEIQKLMRELQQAMAEFLKEMMKGMKNLPNMAQPFNNPNAQSLTPRDLQRLLDRAKELAMTGNLDAARQLLSMLRKMLENLRSGKFAQGRGGKQGKAWKMLRELQDMMKRQQELMDETHRQSRKGKPPSANNGAKRQDRLRDQLGKLLRKFGEMTRKIPRSLGDAELSMREALEALRKNKPGQAVPPQGRALENMRKGLGEMAQQLMRQFGKGRGRGRGQGRGRGRGRGFSQRGGNLPFSHDPLGRPMPNAGMSAGDDVEIPGISDTQRAREILEELRRRAGEIGRPDAEMEYLERLLKRF